jgi:ATP-dependent Clp protease ATP-binding subunit ClpX
MTEHKCSFCGEKENEARVLVGDECGNVYICESCWEKVGMMLNHPEIKGKAEKSEEKMRQPDWSRLSPEKIKQYLDQHIIGQERAKKILSVAVYNHYKMLSYEAEHKDEKEKITIEKSNILMLGPTGVGKTALIKALANILKVPFAISDATTLTENGYVGADPESCIQHLLQAADGDVARAETGIVYIDEIDKLACKGEENMSITRDVSGEGVQQALLKIIEGTQVDVVESGVRRHPNANTIPVDTSRILFIVGGAFVGIDNIIRKRVKSQKVNKRPLGFCLSQETQEKEKCLSFNEIIDKTVAEDLRKYGIIPEMLGRLPVIAPLHELKAGELCRILTEPKNALVKQYQEIFRFDNVNLRFSEGALQTIANKAIQNGTGARGLRSIIENVLLEKMYTIKRNAKGQEMLITKRDIDKAFAEGEQQNLQQTKLAG